MNTSQGLILSVLLAAATGAGITLLATSLTEKTEPAPRDPEGLEALQEVLVRLEQRQAELVEELDRVKVAVNTSVQRATPQPLPIRVAAGGPELDVPAEETPVAEAVEAAHSPIAEQTAKDLAARLLDPETGYDGWNELWQQIREAGRTDEVIAAFEERVEADPYNPEAHTQLGSAYLEKIQEVGNGPLAGDWATKADKSFDSALELDPTNWDARSIKAIALSFWPPIFGKQADAISHFEILVKQQEGMTLTSKHSQTYLLLGNLYQQTGNAEKALAIWRQGLQHFPQDSSLLSKIK